MSDLSAASNHKPRYGDLFDLTIERLDDRGDGVAHAADHRFTLRWAVPGERVRAMVLRRRKTQVEARVVECLAPGALRQAARCAHFGVCGGCTLQSLAYAEQLHQKSLRLERDFTRVGLDPALLAPLVGSEDPWHYRGKMEFSFGNRRYRIEGEDHSGDPDFALGLHARDVYSKVVEIEACHIQDRRCDAILATLRREAQARGLMPWDLRTHQGFLRHAVLRHARATGQILLNLVTAQAQTQTVDAYLSAVHEQHPELSTAVQTVHERAAYGALAGAERVVFGSGRILERLLGLEFEISAQSFFQAHVVQAERLFQALIERLELSSDQVAHDLYCGTGTITLLLARHVRAAVGFECVPEAIADARAAAQRNGIENARFHLGDVLETWSQEAGAADVLVLDPPRAGLHPQVLQRVIERGPARIGYISCNPAAGARDVAALVAAGWRLHSAQGFDLFPHTPHVECLMVLERG